jgi:uncharacterized membrane protein YphA (DoxX/SURF4 family)
MKPADPGSKRAARRAQAIVRWILGAIFLLAGALKIAHPGDFYSDLLAYEVDLPDEIFRCIAIAVPWLEVVCGGALLADFWPETVRFLVVAMSLVFVVMLGQAVLRGLDLNCGCFGRGVGGWFNHPIAALGRAVLLLGAAGWLLSRLTATRLGD